MPILAAVFGFDGTLVDSHEAHFSARQRTLRQLGLVLDRAWYDAHAGASFDEAVTLLADEQGVRVSDPFEEIDKRCTELYLEHLDRVRPVPWVAALAGSLRGRLRLAIASGASRMTVEPTVKAVGLHDLFPVLVSREDVTRGKPSPELFERAADLLGVEPAECLVVDYSDEGMEAARRAGMPAINVKSRCD